MHVFYVMVYNMHIDDQDKLLHAVMNEAKTLTNAERWYTLLVYVYVYMYVGDWFQTSCHYKTVTSIETSPTTLKLLSVSADSFKAVLTVLQLPVAPVRLTVH